MKTLGTLRRSAQQSTHWRGHRMAWDKPGCNDTVQSARCVTCGATVLLLTNPAPNGIAIGGRALAVNCNQET